MFSKGYNLHQWGPYTTMCIVLLCLTHIFFMFSDMNHTTMHGHGVREYCIRKI